MSKFIVCPSCEGTGGSSAYLGSFTSDDIDQMDGEFMEDYFAGNFDRPCEECRGQRVVACCKVEGCNQPVAVINSYWSRTPHVYAECFDHSDEARSSADDQAVGAAERAFGA